jgi:hypothetical protein
MPHWRALSVHSQGPHSGLREALEAADEAEEFQSVGMRCRECLIAMVKAVADLAVVSREMNRRSAPMSSRGVN